LWQWNGGKNHDNSWAWQIQAVFPWATAMVEKLQGSRLLMNPKEDFSLLRSEITVAPENANKHLKKNINCIDLQLCPKKDCSKDPPVSEECHLAMPACVLPFSPDILPQ
jgi:hypothetical protein